MESFGFPVLIILIVAASMLIAAFAMKKSLSSEKADKAIGVIFACLLLASMAVIIASLYIGGWAGMGYGIIGMCVLIGVIIAGFLYAVIHIFSSRKKVRK